MTFEAFDVVVVPFPFTNRDASKRRPALVVSNRSFNETHPVVVLAMVTSAANAGWPSDVSITDLAGAGLKAESVVRMKLFTLDQALIRRKIGALGVRDRTAMERTVRAHLFC